MHRRGETWQGGQTVTAVFDDAGPIRLAAILSAPDRGVLHQYLVAEPRNSTVTELALWSTAQPSVLWPPGAGRVRARRPDRAAVYRLYRLMPVGGEAPRHR